MSCDICSRSSCTNSFHSIEEQRRFSDVIDAFDRARDLRDNVRKEIEEEEKAQSEQEAQEEEG